MVCTQGVENPIIIHSDVGTLREVLRVPSTAKIAESKQIIKKKSEISLNSSMFKMYAIICAVTVFECNTMYEDPPRVFDTKEQCLVAAQMKEDLTIEQLLDEDGHLSVEHLEVGCEPVNNV
jgi:hypothetical protein